MKSLTTWLWASAAIPSSALVVTLVNLIDRYDQLSYRSHSELIRRALPWRISWVAAALPVVALVPGWVVQTASIPFQLAWLVLVLFAAEVYSVAFHRESYIAAFEPWWLPDDAAPLGKRPVRVSDRRLQYLVRTQVLYLAPLVAAVLTVGSESPAVSWVACFLFVFKYIPPAWVDYEAYFHWDMHCRVLQLCESPRLSAFWRNVGEYALGPVVGSLPRLYSTEHLVIHHPANAGPRDIHSPLPFSRTSVIEFGHYMWKTIAVLATGYGIIQHKRCSTRQRLAVLTGVLLTAGVVGLAVAVGSPLGLWLLGSIVYRGTNTSRAQYIWHGLHDGSGSSRPQSTTILWLPSVLPQANEREQVHPREGFEKENIPEPGSDWAFFDNYHLVHHLHPRAHFTEYPALLLRELPRIHEAGSPILTLDGYSSFFNNLLARRTDQIAESFVFPGTVAERIEVLNERLLPWPGVRSSIAAVSETTLGRKLDAGLSAAWSWACR